jgi:serine/threonine protein kinase
LFSPHYQANILVNDDWHAVLADFGLAVFADENESPSGSIGCLRWMAPELLYPESFGLRQSRKTHASDVYAFACVCFEVRGLFLIILFIPFG